MATLKDVAKLACVDVSTVSRAINNTSYVHPATKKRIMEAIEELSYKPNLVKSILKKGKRHTIGVVIPNLNLTIFSDIVHSIKIEAKKNGYSILTCETQNDPEEEAELLDRLRNNLVDGIIIAATGENKTLIRDIKLSGIEVVQIIRNDIKTISSVTANFYSSGYNAVDFLYKLDCKKIGFINGPHHLTPYHERYQGYHDAIVERKIDEINFSTVDLEKDLLKQGYEITKRLLNKIPDLDSMVVSLDMLGVGAMRAAKLFDKRVPEKFKIISLTGQLMGNLLETNITSIEVPGSEIGQKSAEVLIETIEASKENKATLKKVILDTKLVVHQTT